MDEELSRKRRTRGGHRSTATRIITSAIEVLATGDFSEIAKHAVKLNQQKARLQDKRSDHSSTTRLGNFGPCGRRGNRSRNRAGRFGRGKYPAGYR